VGQHSSGISKAVAREITQVLLTREGAADQGIAIAGSFFDFATTRKVSVEGKDYVICGVPLPALMRLTLHTTARARRSSSAVCKPPPIRVPGDARLGERFGTCSGVLHEVHVMILTFAEQDLDGISEPAKREINKFILERHGEDNGVVIAFKFFDFETCDAINLCWAKVT
jgi:hypothetical protein